MNETLTDNLITSSGYERKQHGTKDFPCAAYGSSLCQICYPWHWHEEFELSVLTQGSLWFYTPRETILLGPGDGLFLNSEAMHYVEPYKNTDAAKLDLLFHGRLVYGQEDSVFWKKYVQPLQQSSFQSFPLLGSVPWQRTLLEKAQKTHGLCVTRPAGYEFQVRSLLSEVILELCLHLPGQDKDSRTFGRQEKERVKKMLLYLHENYQRPISLAELSAQVNICERECLRSFKKILRQSPIQYLIRYRILRACLLLTEGSQSILEVCESCGFESPSYFSKTFRSVMGCTPTQYLRGSRS